MEQGAIFCPINHKLPANVIAAQLERLQPKWILASTGWEKRVSPPANLPPSSFLLFTSGSTGTPKIASIPLSSFQNNARSANAVCDLRPNDGWRLSLPLYHVSGLSIVFRCLAAGAKIILDDRDRSVTHLSAVPAQLFTASPIYPNLRCLLLGGGPICTVPMRWPSLISYGLTETASLVLAGSTPDSLWPVLGKQIKLSEEGEVLIKGDSLFAGYWDGHTVHAPLDEEGWFATKDLACFDPQKGYRIVGRKDRQFISGGENIQPEEIEQALLKLEGLIAAIVGPKKDEQYGMRPIAFVKIQSGKIDRGKIQKALSNVLPRYKIPTDFFPLEEPPFSPLKPAYKKIFD